MSVGLRNVGLVLSLRYSKLLKEADECSDVLGRRIPSASNGSIEEPVAVESDE